ncbi:unnamed protein product [Clonostachys rhizophaga]|uniref:Uncharacterized protein n=1 Tax=Clonostachys rhizophaga TaxID=160324 RepID=A0A9N9VD45_9HYPO|nr:unnamed protein product [Clonostachys rhizophaga]
MEQHWRYGQAVKTLRDTWKGAWSISNPLSAGTSSYKKRSRSEYQQQWMDWEAGQAQALDYAYEQAVERIDSQKPGLRDIALQVLAWITQLELQYALAVEPDTTQFEEENLPDIQGMVSKCFGLVTIENERSIIRLAHYTTREYFERTQGKWFPDAEAEITKTCLTYLSYDVFGTGYCYFDDKLIERLRSSPLYDYATKHWGHHARRAPTLTEEIIEFLESGRKVEAACQALLCSTRYEPCSSTGGGTDPDGGLTGLHLAAYFDLDTIMKSLLGSGNMDPNSAVRFKWHGDMTPLSYAAQMGHEAIVKLLLEKDSVGPDSKNAAQRIGAELRCHMLLRMYMSQSLSYLSILVESTSTL